MNLKHLSNDELHSRTKKQAEIVREESTILIHHLVEVERRLLFLKFKCSSLFQYCVDQLKMSEGQAGRYTNSAKVMGEFPEVEEKLLTGSMNMTSISQAQVFFNREEKLNQPLAKEEKQKILEQIENQSTRKAERILLAHSSQPEAVVIEKVRAVTPTLTEIKLAVDDETLADLERMKEIWSHSLPDASFSKLVKKMARFCVEATDPMLKAEKSQQRRENKAFKTVSNSKKSKAASSTEVSKKENQSTQEVAVRNPMKTATVAASSTGANPIQSQSKKPMIADEIANPSKIKTQNAADGLVTSDESKMAKTAAAPLSQTNSAQDKHEIQKTTPAPEQTIEVENRMTSSSTSILSSHSNLSSTTVARSQSPQTANINPVRSTPAPKSSRSRYTHSAVRHAVYLRDEGSCDYIDPATGERCSSRHFSQLDHVVPYAMGGENTVENLRLRCFAHNRLHAVQTYGHSKIMRYASRADS